LAEAELVDRYLTTSVASEVGPASAGATAATVNLRTT